MARGSRTIGPMTRGTAAAIRARRAELGLKQNQIAAATGIEVNMLSAIENERASVDVEQLRAIAVALRTTPGELADVAEKLADEIERDGQFSAAEIAEQHGL